MHVKIEHLSWFGAIVVRFVLSGSIDSSSTGLQKINQRSAGKLAISTKTDPAHLQGFKCVTWLS